LYAALWKVTVGIARLRKNKTNLLAK